MLSVRIERCPQYQGGDRQRAHSVLPRESFLSREVEDLARQVMSEVTRLDVLVNNAGVGFGRDPLTMPFRTKPDRLSRRAQGGRAV
jgi:NAD(P)-dependent dehydrogenase (short-subunit alcohol dehydrogenase family)